MRKGKNMVKKMVSLACISAVLVAEMPCGRVFAAEETAAPNLIAGKEGGTLAPVAADGMQKIYECLLKEDSSFCRQQKELKEMVGDQLTLSASLHENTITITASGKEYYADSSGSWDYTLEGDYLVYTLKEGDDTGVGYFSYITDAVADYLGMDRDLVNGYITGIGVKDLESRYYIMEKDAQREVTKYKIYAGGAYDMDEVLNALYLDGDVLGEYDALSETDTSMIAHIGKVELYLNGKKNSVDIFLGEHGGLTELSYKSLLEVVKQMKPAGYEEFLSNFTELSEVSGETYQVSYVKDTAELPEALKGEEHYKFVKLHFGVPALSASSLSLKAGGFEFLTGEECEVKSWSSSNKKAVLVKDGQVSALKKGTATVTATLTDGKKLTCKVTVTSNPSMKIGGKAYKKNAVYTVKKKGILKAVIQGKSMSVDNQYKNSKKTVAKVTGDGMSETVKIKGLKKGTTKLTIRVNGVDFVFKVKVK